MKLNLGFIFLIEESLIFLYWIGLWSLLTLSKCLENAAVVSIMTMLSGASLIILRSYRIKQ